MYYSIGTMHTENVLQRLLLTLFGLGCMSCILRLHQLSSPAAVPRGCGQWSTQHAWEGFASACSGPVSYSNLQGPLDLGRVTK